VIGVTRDMAMREIPVWFVFDPKGKLITWTSAETSDESIAMFKDVTGAKSWIAQKSIGFTVRKCMVNVTKQQ
jgi:hypothetical protein